MYPIIVQEVVMSACASNWVSYVQTLTASNPLDGREL